MCVFLMVTTISLTGCPVGGDDDEEAEQAEQEEGSGDSGSSGVFLLDDNDVNLGAVLGFSEDNDDDFVDIITSTGYTYSISFDGVVSNGSNTVWFSDENCSGYSYSPDSEGAVIQGSSFYNGLLVFSGFDDGRVCYLTDESDPSGNATTTTEFEATSKAQGIEIDFVEFLDGELSSSGIDGVTEQNGSVICETLLDEDGGSDPETITGVELTCGELSDALKETFGIPETITPPLRMVTQ